MSVASEITKLNTNMLNCYNEAEAKEATMPQNKNMDNLPSTIASIPSGGGGADDYFVSTNSGNLKTFLKKIPDITCTSVNIDNFFDGCQNLIEIGDFNCPNSTKTNYLFQYCFNLETIKSITINNSSCCYYMFNGCRKLTTAPYFNTSNCTTFQGMFMDCGLLENIPIYNTSSATNFSNFISSSSTKNLNDQSLDNILQMCINASSYTGTKTLFQLGFRSTGYSSARIQALTHYQDFLDAGWTIGY